MSKFNKSTVALAVTLALGLPVSAMAATAGYAAGTNATYARNIINSNAQTITTPALFPITVQTSDNIVGRTTGFGVRFTLGNGARFNAAPVLSIGNQLGGGANWTVSPGTLGSSNTQIVYSVQPQVGATGITADAGQNLLNFAANAVTLTNLVTALGGASGGSVPVTIELFDSNTNTVLITLNSTFATSVEGTTVAFDPQQGDVNKRIDVATCTSPSVGPKRRFSPSGAVGASCGAADTDRVEFNAGAITVGIAQAGTPATAVRADGFAGNNNSGNPGAGNFQFDAAADVIDVTITGTNFAPFNATTNPDRIYLTAAANCDIAGALPATRAINTANNSITLSTVANDWGGATGGTLYVCVATTAAAATQIAAQPLNASVAIDFADANVADPSDRAGSMLPLQYNGTVLEFQNVNPAANASAQSFLRFTNNSTLDCPVTLEANDDNGVAGDSAITFTLASKKSLTANSEDLEGGNAGKGLTGSFGDGTGRWYVTATAECGQFVGSALNRNTTDGTVTNLTPDKR